MNNIKKLRAKTGMLQKELAKHLNVAQGTLSYWERGTYDIDNKSLLKIAEYFNVSTDYVLGKTDNLSLTELVIPDILKGVPTAFHRGEFKDLTQEEVDNLAIIAAGYKATRKQAAT